MAYFKYFDTIDYDVRGIKNKPTIDNITNILKRVRMKVDFVKYQSFFAMHTIIDGETPEYLAHEYYGDAELHWVVLSGPGCSELDREQGFSESLSGCRFCGRDSPAFGRRTVAGISGQSFGRGSLGGCLRSPRCLRHAAADAGDYRVGVLCVTDHSASPDIVLDRVRFRCILHVLSVRCHC